ncbi:MAG: hypothetical protein U0L91_01040 [Gemmiger sp.]|uniref:hypothetical protein n=1 Tax=Gemmiger sp. TaxID=2049027 RepID=UPI002E79DC9E|nr:hypothetical protein [Gemmiger sp.]MEE0799843.1 hypothetical protein [Gemmiger sp.]
MSNGIYIQTEYRGKLIRKIVCNGEERWFIGSDCAVTFQSLQACKAAIDSSAN